MKVENWPIDRVKPYPGNPRINKAAVEPVAQSIKEFGFQQPIVVDSNGVVVVGHTRLKAAKKLKMKTVPVVVASGLSEAKIKAYRLADNKTAELAEWDLESLKSELFELTDVDMSDFGFDLEDFEPAPDSPTGEDKPKELDTRNWLNTQIATFNGVGEFDIPQIRGIDKVEPVEWIGFDSLKQWKGDRPFGVHHYQDDYRFEREWSNPKEMIPRLKRAKYVTSPDFSIFTDYPRAAQIWNHYRKHWFAAYMELYAIPVIPTITWSDEESFKWCFDGEPVGKVVSVSSVGIRNSQEAMDNFLVGYNEMLKRLNPSQILFYGKPPKELAGDERILRIKSFQEVQFGR